MAEKAPSTRTLAEAVLAPSSSLVDQFARYLVVGGLAFALDFGCLFLITELFGVYYLASATIAFTVGLLTNYILSVVWVFPSRRTQNVAIEFALFALVGVVGLGLNDLILWTLTDYGGLHYLQSKLAATAVVLFWNFVARKLLLFS